MAQLFAGLDVSDKTTAICVLDKYGTVIWEGVAATEPAALCFALKPYRAVLQMVGLEAGTKSGWLQRALTAKRYPAVCLETRHAHGVLSAQRDKTDASDARGLASLLVCSMYTAAHVKSPEATRTRMLLLTRKMLQCKARDLNSMLRMTLKQFGAVVEKKGDTLVYTEATRRPDRELRALAQPIIRAHDKLCEEFGKLHDLVEVRAKSDPVCRRLMTVPGVGPITALSFRAAIDDPTRFKSSRAVAAYFGLTPRRYQSGQMDTMGGISKRGDIAVRANLYEASRCLIYSCHSESWLRAWAINVVRRRGAKVGTIATARKLCVVLHRMWISGKDFDPDPPKVAAFEPPADRVARRLP